MFFRFAAAIGMLTVIALLAIALEKNNLALKRAISWQHYRLDHLVEQRARLVLETEQLGGPQPLWTEHQRRLEPRDGSRDQAVREVPHE